MPDDVRRPRRPRPGRRVKRWTRRQRISLGAVLVLLVATCGILVVNGNQSAYADPISLLPDDDVPAVVTDPDRVPVELGLRFQTAVPAEAIGAQFYKGPGNRGPHRATLWTGTGRRIANVTFGHESASGLQTAEFDTPVALRPATDYVISYTAVAGRYSADERYFTGPVTNGPLSAQRDAGVFSYRPGSFPTRSFAASSYTVDIVVRPTGPSPSPTASATATSAPTPPEPTPTGTTAPPPSDTAGPTPDEPDPGDATDTLAPPPTVTAEPTPTAPTPTETAAPPPASGTFPTRDTAGLPDGWTPKREVTGNVTIDRPGEVVEDLRITNGTIMVEAPNVTLRRIEAVGSNVMNEVGTTCNTGLLIEDSSFVRGPGATSDAEPPVVAAGGYTVRNIVIDGVPEGLRASDSDVCGGITVEDSFIRVVSPDRCTDWHGDGIQGYGGGEVTVRQTAIFMEVRNDCYGTAPFFVPQDQGNTSVDIDGLVVGGGGYPFRSGMTGPVRNLYVVEDSWVFGPIDVVCSAVTAWSAYVARLDAAGQPVPLRPIPCTG